MITQERKIEVVLWSKSGKALPTRSVTGLSAEERQKVRAGVPVMVWHDTDHRNFGWRQAVWSGGKFRFKFPAKDLMEAFVEQLTGHRSPATPAPEKTYEVTIRRTILEYATLRVSARSAAEAERAAKQIGFEDTIGVLDSDYGDLGWEWDYDAIVPDLQIVEETEETTKPPKFRAEEWQEE